jgi:hypothetical protein
MSSSDSLKQQTQRLVTEATKQTLEVLQLNNNDSVFYFMLSLIIVVFIIFLVISWIVYTLKKYDSSCTKLNKIYLDNSKHKTSSFSSMLGDSFTVKDAVSQDRNSTNYFDHSYNSLIRNYYIKTAYNACCGDGYKNNFVTKCALKKCIELGARCLDFEIYSYNNEPIVAASTANNNSIKETYNYIKLSDVFEILNEQCFDLEFTDCAYDPMFLHFRIMSENSIIYDKIGEYIKNNLINNTDNILDDKKYNYYKSNPQNFLRANINNGDFNKKFIIMVNTLYPTTLRDSKLKNYVHLLSGTSSSGLKMYRYDQLVAAGRENPLIIDESKSSLIIALPNLNNSLENHDPLLALGNGCQFVAMKFQNLDNNLLGYYKMFADSGGNDGGNGFSFILKPKELREDILPPDPPVDVVELNPAGSDSIGGGGQWWTG